MQVWISVSLQEIIIVYLRKKSVKLIRKHTESATRKEMKRISERAIPDSRKSKIIIRKPTMGERIQGK